MLYETDLRLTLLYSTAAVCVYSYNDKIPAPSANYLSQISFVQKS